METKKIDMDLEKRFNYHELTISALEKLQKLFFEVDFEFAQSGWVEITAKYHVGTINVVGKTINEAMSKCIIEYFNLKELENE